MIDGKDSLRRTEERLEEIERHLNGIYSDVLENVSKRWKEFLAPLDAEIKKYDRAMNNPMDAEVRKKAEKKREQIIKQKTIMNKRFRTVSTKISHELSRTNETALAYINGEVPEVFADNCNDFTAQIRTETGEKFGVNVRFDLVDGDTVRRLAAEDVDLLPDLPPEKLLNIPKDERWNRQLIRSELLKGILTGEDIPSIAARMHNVVGMNERSAMTNARTMVTAAQNGGRMEGMRRAENMGVVLKRVWMSADDGRVRSAHRELDGQTRDMNEPFVNAIGKIMFPGDPHADPANVYNCRCTLGAEIVGFRKSDGGISEVEYKGTGTSAPKKPQTAKTAKTTKPKAPAKEAAKKTPKEDTLHSRAMAAYNASVAELTEGLTPESLKKLSRAKLEKIAVAQGTKIQMELMAKYSNEAPDVEKAYLRALALVEQTTLAQLRKDVWKNRRLK